MNTSFSAEKWLDGLSDSETKMARSIAASIFSSCLNHGASLERCEVEAIKMANEIIMARRSTHALDNC